MANLRFKPSLNQIVMQKEGQGGQGSSGNGGQGGKDHTGTNSIPASEKISKNTAKDSNDRSSSQTSKEKHQQRPEGKKDNFEHLFIRTNDEGKQVTPSKSDFLGKSTPTPESSQKDPKDKGEEEEEDKGGKPGPDAPAPEGGGEPDGGDGGGGDDPNEEKDDYQPSDPDDVCWSNLV